MFTTFFHIIYNTREAAHIAAAIGNGQKPLFVPIRKLTPLCQVFGCKDTNNK